MKLAIVEWIDSAFVEGWKSKELIREHNFAQVTSAGILMNEIPDLITIVQSVSNSGNAGDGITIPRCAVKRIRILKVRNERTSNK